MQVFVVVDAVMGRISHIEAVFSTVELAKEYVEKNKLNAMGRLVYQQFEVDKV
jgi:hypothetical protein